jgi:hypothetical protein
MTWQDEALNTFRAIWGEGWSTPSDLGYHIPVLPELSVRRGGVHFMKKRDMEEQNRSALAWRLNVSKSDFPKHKRFKRREVLDLCEKAFRLGWYHGWDSQQERCKGQGVIEVTP